MACLQCKDLERYFDEMQARYEAARTSAYYRVCTELGAKREVDMERAKSALDEHREVCATAVAEQLLTPKRRSENVAGLTVRPAD